MEILLGKRSGALDREGLLAKAGGCSEFLVDVGAGSGRFAYEVARPRPDFFCVALDAERRNMAKTALRAARKPERGGAPNLLCAVSAAEAMPEELRSLATRITVNLPWGSLLRGIAKAEGQVLRPLRDIAAPGACLEALVAYDEKYEPAAIQRLGLPPLSPELVEDVLPEAYARHGLEIVEARILDNAAVRHIPLDWGRALAHGRRREFYVIVARFDRSTPAKAKARSAPVRAYPCDNPPFRADEGPPSERSPLRTNNERPPLRAHYEPSPLRTNNERPPLRAHYEPSPLPAHYEPPCEHGGSLLLDMARPPAVRCAKEAVRFTAKGHPNLTATHAVSLEIARSPDLSPEGDCLIAVGADFDADAVRRLAGYRKLHVTLRSGPVEETFECGVNDGFGADDEIVFRKSAHRSPRTLGIGASKSAAQVGRLLVERLRRPGAAVEVAIVPMK